MPTPRAQRHVDASMGSMSLFELPVSKGARAARVTAVVLLNLVLAGAGIAMIASYWGDRAEAARGSTTTQVVPEPPPPDLDVLEPDVVDVDEVKQAPSKPAKKLARRSKKPSRPRKTATAKRSNPRKAGDDSDIPLPRKPPKAAGSGNGTDTAAPDTDTTTGAGSDPIADPDVAPDPPPPPDPVDDGVAPDGTIEDPVDDQRVEFSAAKVRRVVDRHRVQLQRCYKAAAKSRSVSDPLAGRVDVQFVINPDGTASNVTPVANATGSRELATCVSKLIESWQFPSPGAEDIAFVWPFVFRAP